MQGLRAPSCSSTGNQTTTKRNKNLQTVGSKTPDSSEQSQPQAHRKNNHSCTAVTKTTIIIMTLITGLQTKSNTNRYCNYCNTQRSCRIYQSKADKLKQPCEYDTDLTQATIQKENRARSRSQGYADDNRHLLMRVEQGGYC